MYLPTCLLARWPVSFLPEPETEPAQFAGQWIHLLNVRSTAAGRPAGAAIESEKELRSRLSKDARRGDESTVANELDEQAQLDLELFVPRARLDAFRGGLWRETSLVRRFP